MGKHYDVLKLVNLVRMVFNDFGTEFKVIDQSGEEPINGMIAAIAKVIKFTVRSSLSRLGR